MREHRKKEGGRINTINRKQLKGSQIHSTYINIIQCNPENEKKKRSRGIRQREN